MIINVANFNFGGDGGGGGKLALLQEKTATIVQNGSQTITPDEGFDGMSSVQINAAITGASSAIDFSPIGYSAELSAEVNAKLNDDVAYSKSLLDAWNPSNTSTYELYSGDKKLLYAPKIDTRNVTSMSSMFSDCASLISVPLFDTRNVTSMNYMFGGCSRLTSVPLFDTSNVTNMNQMFCNCSNLKTVPAFNTSNVASMYGMLSGCTNLTSVSELDTSKVTNINRMFYGCSGLTSVPLFDTRNVIGMEYMFYGCSGLTSVPLFDTSNVKTMQYMFYHCSNLKTVPAFNTSKVTSMYGMFSRCSGLTSVQALDTSNVTNFDSMFEGCHKLTTIEGISFKSFKDSTMSSSYLYGMYINNSTRKAVFKDIGYQSTAKQFNTESIRNWGVNTDDITDARQSLIDSLITYSFDRATAGYPTCEIKLYSTTKSLLTSDEIAQIESKGFTIA